MARPIAADLTGKTCVVTGANTGIGKEIARGLARLGARVILACRSRERGQAALEELRAETGNDALVLRELDLSRAASIEAFAASVAADPEPLHALVNNAGVWLTTRQEGEGGMELTFATNALGPFRLTHLLEAKLKASAPARVVDLASKMAYGLDLDDLAWRRRRFDGAKAYAQSKAANRMLAQVRAERLKDAGVTVNAVHPGVVATEIARDGRGLFGLAARGYFRLFGRTPAQGADTAIYLAASPEVEGVSGQWWYERVGKPERKFGDREQNLALWRRCEELCGVAVAG